MGEQYKTRMPYKQPKRSQQRSCRNRAFTMIEMVVAVGVLAFFLAAYTALTTVSINSLAAIMGSSNTRQIQNAAFNDIDSAVSKASEVAYAEGRNTQILMIRSRASDNVINFVYDSSEGSLTQRTIIEKDGGYTTANRVIIPSGITAGTIDVPEGDTQTGGDIFKFGSSKGRLTVNYGWSQKERGTSVWRSGSKTVLDRGNDFSYGDGTSNPDEFNHNY